MDNGVMKKSKLEQKTPLKRTRIKPISDKQGEINKLWNEVTDESVKEECYICQWCKEYGQRNDKERFDYLDGHHKIPRRFNVHTKKNCYIVHRHCHPMADRYVREYKEE